jgi:hypothetical protein
MRIKSTFKDYYDGVQSFNTDFDFVYHRFPKEEILEQYPYVYSTKWGCGSSIIERCITIGFCGKIYTCIGLTYANYGKPNSREVFCYSVEHVDSFAYNNFSKKELEYYLSGPGVYYRKSPSGISYNNKQNYYKDFFKNIPVRDDYQIFQKNYSPIFYAEYVPSYSRPEKTHKRIWNEKLDQFGFAKVMPPYQAYQEISMFLGGLASPEKTIPDISDKIMVEVKGFDTKYSFRKAPQK